MITRRLCAEHGAHVFLDVKSLFRDEPSALAMFLNATQESAGWMRRDVNVGKMQKNLLNALVVVEKDPKALILTRNAVFRKFLLLLNCSNSSPKR